MAGSRPSALVYGDVDLNLLDGSAIWLQSVTQALVAAGCAVTLVLKAPVRTDRLVAPLRELPAVTIRLAARGGAAARGWTEASLTVPQAVAVLAAGRRRRDRHDLVVLRGRALVSAAARDGAFDGRLWSYLTDVPQAVPAVTPKAAEDLTDHRQGVALPAVPDRGAALLPRGHRRRRLRQVGAVPAGAARARHPPRSRRGVAPAGTPLKLVYTGKFAPRWNTLEMTAAARPAGRPRRRRRGAHGRRQGARRPARPRLQAADARPRSARSAPPARARRDLARRAAAGRGDAAGRRRATSGCPGGTPSSTRRLSCRPRSSSSASSGCR